MKISITKQELIDFEENIVKLFENKQICSPIHLDNGNEDQLIEVFSNHVNENDWVLGTWRSHLKSLLRGVPPNKLESAIIDGRSIGLCFPEYKVLSSAIVGGVLGIAVGIAIGIKRSEGTNKVVCFLGDMASETGHFHECHKYAKNFNLPILWVLEDNGRSVCTPTRETWGTNQLTYEPKDYTGGVVWSQENVLYYKYTSKWPHAGGGKRIQF